MDIYEHRRTRLLALINERFEGLRKKFCDHCGWSEARISQLLSVTYRNGQAFTEKTARKLEVEARLPVMYFDQGAAPALAAAINPIEDGDEDLSPFREGAQNITVDNPNTDVIPIRLVNLRVQAGFPRFKADEVYDDDATIDLPRQWVEENQLVPNCLIGIRVRGNSMEPMLFDDEKIIINIADTKLVSGSVYALNFEGDAVVKQMVYNNRQWYMSSINYMEYPPMSVREGSVIVIGKLVYQPGRSLIGKL